ncbi:MAG: right-handed parallel beta-helix repeat-containing protein [Bacteroidia bacterium]|nr:right-handed parallel beta-helix repeat-containing protein [Bacteroidia bacterium]MDW8157697.1 right-handed parallel beta-helix repeat-containing protein [Bacteroidia bacterium]
METTELFEDCVIRLLDQLGLQVLKDYELANTYLYFPGAPHLVNSFLAAVRQQIAVAIENAVHYTKTKRENTIQQQIQELIENQWIEAENAQYIVNLFARILIPIKVGQEKYSDFSSLQEAYEAAAPYSTIHLLPGTYNEPLVLKKPIIIVGTGKQGEVIIESNDRHTIEARSNYAILRNLYIHCAADPGEIAHGIYLAEGQLSCINSIISSTSDSNIKIEGKDTFLTLRNCKITGSNSYGLHFTDRTSGLVESCQIFENENIGVCLEGQSNPVLRSCRIYKNNANGVSCNGSSSATFEDCEVFENEASGVVLDDECKPIFTKCWIYRNNGDGLFCDHSTAGTFEDCWFYENQYLGVVVEGESKTHFTHCRVYKNKDSAVTCDNQSSSYFENCTFTESAVDAVILETQAEARFIGCYFEKNVARALSLRQDTWAYMENCTFSENKGFSLFLTGNSKAEVRKCIFQNNNADGIIITTPEKATFEECTICRNPTGVVLKDKAAPYFHKSLFYDNECNIYIDSKSASPLFEDCIFYGGEQAFNFPITSSYLQNCKIEGEKSPLTI